MRTIANERKKRHRAHAAEFKGKVGHLRRPLKSRDVYADRGYPTTEREATLKQAGWRVHIQRKGSATKGISDAQKKRNWRIATPRARVEHIFGALAQMGGKLVRCMGIVRVTNISESEFIAKHRSLL